MCVNADAYVHINLFLPEGMVWTSNACVCVCVCLTLENVCFVLAKPL